MPNTVIGPPGPFAIDRGPAHPVAVLCQASQQSEAQQGAWQFHAWDRGRLGRPPLTWKPADILTLAVTDGSVPVTGYFCVRPGTADELERIEVYQQWLVANGQPRVPVTLTLDPTRGATRVELDAYEQEYLAANKLRRAV